MGTLRDDIKTQSDWIVKAFSADGYKLDYTLRSLMEIDRFMLANAKDGQPVRGGRLTMNLGPILFSAGAYVGETFLKLVPGATWLLDEQDPQGEFSASVVFPDESQVWPMIKMMKRYQNGLEDAVYPYAHHVVANYLEESFDDSFWTLESRVGQKKKPWWRFW
ncbi:MAG: hypothetical protein EOO38_06185 [Cytophagaceae bacterium]|nr:MAG: hypothetical protein EOO38_06185 [Cytophagaceae bacterium]